jgi:hypothetical protein
VDIIDLNLKSVRFHPGIIDGVKIVDGSIRDAGTGLGSGEESDKSDEK